MKTIKRNFDNVLRENPWSAYWSTYMCFAGAIKHKEFSKEAIRRWFNKLVDKEDYCSQDKKAILAFLFDLSQSPWPSKQPEDDQKWTSSELMRRVLFGSR